MNRPATLAVMTFCVWATAATAQSGIKNDARVRDGIIFVGMAYEISQKCSALRARTLRGLGYLQELKSYAQAQGYSNAEIDAYINDSTEKRRLERLARQQLSALGAVDGDEASYCAVGRDQMDRNTRVGWLLR